MLEQRRKRSPIQIVGPRTFPYHRPQRQGRPSGIETRTVPGAARAKSSCERDAVCAAGGRRACFFNGVNVAHLATHTVFPRVPHTPAPRGGAGWCNLCGDIVNYANMRLPTERRGQQRSLKPVKLRSTPSPPPKETSCSVEQTNFNSYPHPGGHTPGIPSGIPSGIPRGFKPVSLTTRGNTPENTSGIPPRKPYLRHQGVKQGEQGVCAM